jgi:hypothetical protein
MRDAWPPEIADVLSVGQYLGEETGEENWALTRAQASEAAARLAELGLPILGGDVYESRDGKLVHNYDSWHTDRQQSEPIADFVARSYLAATSYITSYQPNKDKYYFSLVPDPD